MIAAGVAVLSATACGVNATAQPHPSLSRSQPSAIATNPSSAAPDAHAARVTEFVPTAWPAAAELPFASVYRWTPRAPEEIVTANGEPLYTCDNEAAIPHLSAIGYQVITYQRDPATSNAGLSVATLFFPDTPHAQHALEQVRSDYASCTAHSQRDTVTNEMLVTRVTQTASSQESVAYVHDFRRSNNTPGSPEGVASDSHEYFAQRGNLIALVRVSGGPRIDAPDKDTMALRALMTHLSQYQPH